MREGPSVANSPLWYSASVLDLIHIKSMMSYDLVSGLEEAGIMNNLI